MSEAQEPGSSPEAERARAALRAIETPPADPALRERLKEEFVSGGIAARAPTPTPSRQYARFLPWGAAAAAAVLAIVLGVILNRGPAWRVTTATGSGDVRVDGKSIAIDQVEALRSSIRSGVEFAMPSQGEVEIVSGSMLAIQLTPDTRLTVPPPPSRWIGRSTGLDVRAGELRVTTGKAFEGARLDVRTPDAAINVTGTTLAVIIEPTGTCVCVLEGEVRMGKAGEEMQVVPAGRRGYAFRDARPLMTEEIRPMERTKLTMFRDARQATLGREPRGGE